MNKTAIKNFAIWARRKLIADITYKAGTVGVSENGIAQPLPQSTRDLQFFDIGTKSYAEVSGAAIEQRNALVKVIQTKEKGSDYKTAFRNVVEEVSYTWFNRLIAVRFMEVNDYLPSKVRVLSSESEGKLEPDFVTTPFETDLDFTPFERDLVLQQKDNNKLDDLFRMLFIKQCNKLSEILPGLFEKISDYTELLLNISFTDKDGIVYHLTHDISEDEFNVEKEGQVEIIGWMYQYYNTEPKDEVFALLKKNVKITKERIPAATQLFTPDWIVRYMVENSLGRLWVEGHPNERLKENWKYYLEEAEQEPDVIEQLKKIREEYAQLSPTDIKIIDPCMGSGHILVYAFDVLMQIYVSQGYTERDAAKSILLNNLYGIDIDTRAYQLAYFAVMMKARQFNRKIFGEHITPNLIAIKNPENVSKSVLKRLGGLEPVGLRMLEDFEDAEEYGSILQVSYTEDELSRLEKKLEEIEQEAQYGNLLVQMEAAECVRLIRPLIKQARLLAQKYEVVVTNPPYMGLKKMNPKLAEHIMLRFPDSKHDLSMVFIQRALQLVKGFRFVSLITQHSWMFQSSYESLRNQILLSKTLHGVLHLGSAAFEEISGEVVQTSAFVIRNSVLLNYYSKYIRLVNVGDKEIEFLSHKHEYIKPSELFMKIPKCIIAYWLSDTMIQAFSKEAIEDYVHNFQGIIPGDAKFLRFWYEVDFAHIIFGSKDPSILASVNGFFPYAKGGSFRRWYGNNEYILLWRNNGEEFVRSRTENRNLFFRQGITWSDISTSLYSARFLPEGFLFDAAGPMIIPDDSSKTSEILAYMNTPVFQELIDISCQGIHYGNGSVISRPFSLMCSSRVDDLVNQNIELSKADWDSFETSWDFCRHPLVINRNKNTTTCINNAQADGRQDYTSGIESIYKIWEQECKIRFDCMKINEEEINRIYIDLYGLQEELSSLVTDVCITVHLADLNREIRSFISYAVGCMFGRYSLDVEGLAFAGGEWNTAKYISYIPDVDNCIPITDEAYFQDDIVGRFVEFVRIVYGSDCLESNLEYIAKALNVKGSTSREAIRNYFLNDFYKDHLKIYQKRPIYWLFDSGKENGFKALVYMHRWNEDTVGNVRVEYLHKMQTVYEHEIESCQYMIDHGSSHEIVSATRRKEKLTKQIKECKDYDALVAHIALSRIDINLDDGVKANYRKVQTGADGKFCEILANSKDIMAKEK